MCVIARLMSDGQLVTIHRAADGHAAASGRLVDREVRAGDLVVLVLRGHEAISRRYLQVVVQAACELRFAALVEQAVEFRVLLVVSSSFAFRVECQINRAIVGVLVQVVRWPLSSDVLHSQCLDHVAVSRSPQLVALVLVITACHTDHRMATEITEIAHPAGRPVHLHRSVEAFLQVQRVADAQVSRRQRC